MWSELFRYSTNPEVFMDEDNLRNLLSISGIRGVFDFADISDFETLSELELMLDILCTRKKSQDAAWSDLSSRTDTSDMGSLFDRTLMEQASPLAAVFGVWLQGLSAPSVFEDEVHLKILSLLADDIGVGSAGNGRKDKIGLIGKILSVPNYTTDASKLIINNDISDEMYCLPALLFALSRRSDAFGPELAGIDFALRSLGVLPVWRCLMDRHSELNWDAVDLSCRQSNALANEDSPISISRWIMEQYAVNGSSIKRLYDGIAWIINGLEQWNSALVRQISILMNPELSMAKLLKERAREASAYHRNYRLKGKSLSAWFQEAASDPFPLLNAIAASPLVRPKDPENSPLISTLLRPNRSMFRVFKEKDIATIKRWIETLDNAHSYTTSRQRNLIQTTPTKFSTAAAGDFTLGEVPGDLREAYYILQGRAIAPKTRDFAIDYVDKWLLHSRQSIDKTDRSLPAAYIPGQLQDWLLDSHDKNVNQIQLQRENDIPSREEVIDQTLQLAPLTLIDGAWLQGFTDIGLATQEFGAPLFQIYWDELGNGDKSINHPKIYRDVLSAMGIELPPTGSRAFAYEPRLNNESFRLPVYWLCLGKLPSTYRLEILGMNLAMELSGVGGGYVAAHRFLKHHKFPTIFVSLHNTIDNVSTGHSAWSVDAIEEYMQQVSQYTDINEAWTRIRSGYESLAPIAKRASDLDYFKNKPCLTSPANNFAAYRHLAISDLQFAMEQSHA